MGKSQNRNNSLDTSLAKISLLGNNLIEIRFKFDTYEVDVKDQEEIRDAYFKLTNGGEQACHILVVTGKYGSVTKEAREKEMFEDEPYQNVKSICIVVNSISQKLLGKLYFALKEKKLSAQYKFFETEAKALEWIKMND